MGAEVLLLSTERLGSMGFALAAYPLTLLSTAAFGMRQALIDLQAGHTPEQILSSEEMKTLQAWSPLTDAPDRSTYKKQHNFHRASIQLISIGSRGDLEPYLALLEELLQRGHDVH